MTGPTLVAGGAGFLGSHLVDVLLAAGRDVVVIDDLSTGRRQHLDRLAGLPGVRVEIADITEPLPGWLLHQPFDRIYHLASPASPVGYARLPIETLRVNSIGTQRLLDLARRHGSRVLYTSTSEVYGDPLVHPQPETYWGNVNPVGPRSCYDEAKRFGESLVTNYVRVHAVDARIARIFNTYGPRADPEDGRMIPNFCVQAIHGRPLTIYGDGQQTRSLCYVDDLVRGLAALMDTDGLTGEVVNLGSPDEHTVRDIADKVISGARSGSEVVHLPLPVDDPRKRRPDLDKAGRLLGWSPAVDLADGLERTLAWFREELILESSGGAATFR